MTIQTMYDPMINSPETKLTSDISSSDTSIPVEDATKLPTAPNIATIGSGVDAETILYTGISSNTLTGVTRGFQSTAKSWFSGDHISRSFTAYDHDTLINNVTELCSTITTVDGLGPSDLATAAQGAKADTALQQSILGSQVLDSAVFVSHANHSNNRLDRDELSISDLLLLDEIDSKILSPNLQKFYTDFSGRPGTGCGSVDSFYQPLPSGLSQGAGSILLPSVSGLLVGMEITIQDTTNIENILITAINGNTITLATPLVYSYTSCLVYRSRSRQGTFNNGDIIDHSGITDIKTDLTGPSMGCSGKLFVMDDDGNLYCTFNDFVNSVLQVFILKSTDNGLTWVDMSFPINSLGHRQSAAIKADSLGNIHMACTGTGTNGNTSLYYGKYDGSWTVTELTLSGYCIVIDIETDSNNDAHILYGGYVTGDASTKNRPNYLRQVNGVWQTPILVWPFDNSCNGGGIHYDPATNKIHIIGLLYASGSGSVRYFSFLNGALQYNTTVESISWDCQIVTTAMGKLTPTSTIIRYVYYTKTSTYQSTYNIESRYIKIEPSIYISGYSLIDFSAVNKEYPRIGADASMTMQIVYRSASTTLNWASEKSGIFTVFNSKVYSSISDPVGVLSDNRILRDIMPTTFIHDDKLSLYGKWYKVDKIQSLSSVIRFSIDPGVAVSKICAILAVPSNLLPTGVTVDGYVSITNPGQAECYVPLTKTLNINTVELYFTGLVDTPGSKVVFKFVITRPDTDTNFSWTKLIGGVS